MTSFALWLLKYNYSKHADIEIYICMQHYSVTIKPKQPAVVLFFNMLYLLLSVCKVTVDTMNHSCRQLQTFT